MIRKLSENKITPLNHISVSQYFSAINCPFKLVLANSFGYRPLLPLTANAHFGSIAHKMIELISRGLIFDEQTFTSNWVELISKKEIELKKNGFESIIPLKYFVTDFALKKNQIRNILLRRSKKINYSQETSSSKYYSEKRLENFDKSVIGVADLIIENDLGTKILEFKTGKIYSEAIDEDHIEQHILKREYEAQLMLYAHLYFLMNGKYPSSLFLVSLSKDFIEIMFKIENCEKVYKEVLEFLSTTNTSIVDNDFDAIAKPSLENCRYCLYRPACNFYSKWLIFNFETMNDLFGVIKKVNIFGNISLGLELQTNDMQILINGFSTLMKEKFEELIGKSITIYNLKKSKQSFNSTANLFTTVYE